MSDRVRTAIVSFLLIVGYLAFGYLLLIGWIKPSVSGEVALVLVGGVFGVLTTGFILAVAFELGSSAGSRSKDALIAGQLPPPNPPIIVPPPAPLPAPLPKSVPAPAQPPSSNAITIVGKVSNFGGPDDKGVSPSEGLALCEPSEINKFSPDLFLSSQPPGTTGLARRLNPNSLYIACRWDYKQTPRGWLQSIKVRCMANGKTVDGVQPIDWGPNIDTGRVADLSLGVLAALGISTDDAATIIIPLPGTPPVAAPAAPSSGEPPWLTLARAEIGFHELPDNHGIQRYVDLAGYGADGEPWCAIFAGAMLRKAGIDIKGVNAMARSFSTAPSFTKIDAPRLGCLAVFWRGSKDGTEGHVGFYVGDAAPGRINILGGNENDAVMIESIPISGSTMGLLGYWWPASTEPKVI
jgi:uncharacterized protein (TIGR02594 family)